MTAEFPQRPFCSPRCRLIDLGSWADESHRIEGAMLGPDLMVDPDLMLEEFNQAD